MSKSALIAFGNEESYGLSFVAGELLSLGQDFKFFEGNCVSAVIDYRPDFIMFSPLTTFFEAALSICSTIKIILPKVTSVFGGHHVVNFTDAGDYPCIDTIVVGPVRGAMNKVLAGVRGIIKSALTNPDDMPFPARAAYYNDIPRVGNRYRKFLLSMLGCPWCCSYCSSSFKQRAAIFGARASKKYYLTRRSLSTVIDEAKVIASYNTKEIEWVDDDIFTGDEGWLLDFIEAWKSIGLPMYISASSVSTLNASNNLLFSLGKFTSAVGLGVQATNPKSLDLFDRGWDSIEKIKDAYNRLRSFGYRVNLQCIVGLPVDNPVDDALETILAVKKIAPGSIISCYPLMIYPGTKMNDYCRDNGFELNKDCNGDTNSATCAINFSPSVNKKLYNICKLATFFVKYNLDEMLIRALINIDIDDDASQQLSMLRYRECVVDRLGALGDSIFDSILKGMNLKF